MILQCPLEAKVGYFRLPATISASQPAGPGAAEPLGSQHHMTWNYSAQISRRDADFHIFVLLQAFSAAGETRHRLVQGFYPEEQIYNIPSK